MADYFDSTKVALEEQILPGFAEIHPEITVDINYTAWNKYNEELTTAFAAGVTPDLMQGGAIFVPQFAYRELDLAAGRLYRGSGRLELGRLLPCHARQT